MGFVAEIILWDLETRSSLHRMELHKGKVQSLDFSHDEKYLISLGGQDDNAIVLWEVETGGAICGSPTDGSHTYCIKFLRNCNSTIVTGGAQCGVRFWDYDKPNNKLRRTDVNLGQLRRIVNCIFIDHDDEYLYCGTTTGDLLQVSIRTRLLRRSGPSKTLISGGITSIVAFDDRRVLAGSGDGNVRLLTIPNQTQSKLQKSIIETRSVHLDHTITNSSSIKVTSMLIESIDINRVSFLIGTDQCDIHRVHYDKSNHKLTSDLICTAHANQINDLTFPIGLDSIFATCGSGDIRLWHPRTCRELIRILVPNLDCNCICFSHDGSFLFSGWSDGSIRVFRPQSGRLECKRPDAHTKSVMALAYCRSGDRLISGGDDGTVRVWRLIDRRLEFLSSMKEHKSAVTSIAINPALDDECTSCSEDSSCVIWNLTSFHRRNSLFANTCFRSVEYHPDGSQLITTGTDRKITYWDPFDGQTIRTIEGSESDPLNALGIDAEGEMIISGGGDSVVKQWNYDEGICYHEGLGHSGAILKTKVSPSSEIIISVGSEGGIFIWSCPKASEK
eukprot:g6095.t1